MDDEIAEIYNQVSTSISRDEFDSLIHEKVALMGGLCDPLTAAMLVARELGAGEVEVKIKSIRPESGSVVFLGRVLSISDTREFSRSDGSSGRVANLTIGDETGTIRVVLWDEATVLIKSGDIRADLCYRVRGIAREGRAGTEVSIGRNCGLQEIDDDIKVRLEPYKIGEVQPDMSEVNLLGLVVDAGEMREFARRDGSKGIVRSVVLGDETGKIRLTLWNDLAKLDISEGETLEVINGTSRERYGQVEINATGYTVVRKSNALVKYFEKMTPIAELEVGKIASITGFVSGIGDVREFQREDGTPGQVTNIYVSDDTGRVKVALWGDLVRLIEGVDLGYIATVQDGQVRSGWNEELEVSCGWRSRITFAPPG